LRDTLGDDAGLLVLADIAAALIRKACSRSSSSSWPARCAIPSPARATGPMQRALTAL